MEEIERERREEALQGMIGKDVDIRLLRKLPRWDLRSPSLYSSASVYDCTAITRGNRHQMLYFKMADELRQVELQILRLKLIQFPNGRHPPHTSQCTFAVDHPVCLEPSFNCGNEGCVTCRVVHETRGFVNACYEAQHRVCSNAEVQGLISRGSHVFQEITENQLYSILFMKRRNTNARGTPVRAAIQWVLLEEARLAVSACLNQENYSEIRVLRDQIKRFIDGYPVLDGTFSARITEPLMPVNPLWQQGMSEQVNEVGMLLEVQVVACHPSMLSLARCWWPLTSAVMSRHMNVVLGVKRLDHIRESDPAKSLSLHNPEMFLSPLNTSRRTIGNHMI